MIVNMASLVARDSDADVIGQDNIVIPSDVPMDRAKKKKRRKKKDEACISFLF